MMKNNEQIGVGDSPGDSKYESGKVYVNPYPFNENTIDQSLSRQVVNICLEWNKVEWKELKNNIEQKIASEIYDSFAIALCND
jgi:hypothetical protein